MKDVEVVEEDPIFCSDIVVILILFLHSVVYSGKGRTQAWSENLSSGPGPFSYPENFWGLGFVLAGE